MGESFQTRPVPAGAEPAEPGALAGRAERPGRPSQGPLPAGQKSVVD